MAPSPFSDIINLDKVIQERLKIPDHRMKYICFGVIAVLSAVCIVLGLTLGLGVGGIMEVCIFDQSIGPEFQPIVAEGCLTTECMETAARLMENMDTNSDPCEDFHKYACGGWSKRHSIPSDDVQFTVRNKMIQENDEKVREILRSAMATTEYRSSSERKLKLFYKMCLQDYGRMRNSSRDFLALIKQHIKGWYILDPDNWNNNGWDRKQAISTLQAEMNVNLLMKMSIGMFAVSKEPVVLLYSSGTTLNYRNYLRTDPAAAQIMELYKDYMRKMVSLLIRDANVTLNSSELNRRVEQFVSDAYGQEEHLAQLLQGTYSSRYRRSTTTIAALEANLTELPWRQIIVKSFDGFQVTGETQVRLSPYAYFMKVNELLRNESTDDGDRMMNNYIVWKMIHTYGRYLSWEYKYTTLNFYEKAYRWRSFSSTWKQCVWLVETRVGAALTAQFMDKHADNRAKEQVELMYGHLHKALDNSIEHIHWMDNDTKAVAEDKVKSMARTISYPDNFFNHSTMDSVYDKLIINETQGFFLNLINVERFRRHIRTLQVHSGKHYYAWRYILRGGAGGAAPVYYWRTNYLLVPPGAMQTPMFQTNYPFFVNLGALGSQMAGEMIESISKQGRYSLSNGTLNDWWTADSYSGYLRSANCFSNYFSGMKLGPYLVNGENKTVVVTGTYQSSRAVELVASMRTALKAYHDWASEFGPEHMPVGLNLTPDQAFFVSAAQTQCFIRTDSAAYRYARWRRLPEDMLLNGVLSHMPEFAKVFQCKVNSTLVAPNTCSVF